MPIFKTCTLCGKTKLITEFHRRKVDPDGHRTYCKQCANERRSKYYAENREREDARNLSWHAENREQRGEHKRKWREANKEHISEHGRQYYAENKERMADYRRQWEKANPDKVVEKVHRRRARKLSADGSYTPADIRALLNAQRGRCVYCQADIREGYTVDHITPLSRGGSNWPDNLQLLCRPCNSAKGDKTHDEYVRRLR